MTPLTLLLSQTLGNKHAADFLNKLLISKNKGATETLIFMLFPLGFMQRQFCVSVQSTLIWKSEKSVHSCYKIFLQL